MVRQAATLVTILGLTLLGPPACTGSSPAPKPAAPPQVRPPAMAAPAHLPRSARRLLRQRMHRHGEAMNELMWAVLYLDYERAEALGAEIAREPRLARPLLRDATELNSMLPEAFFTAQDALAQRAAQVATVAPNKDPQALSAAAGGLIDACPSCHSAYLRPPAQP